MGGKPRKKPDYCIFCDGKGQTFTGGGVTDPNIIGCRVTCCNSCRGTGQVEMNKMINDVFKGIDSIFDEINQIFRKL